MKEFFKEYVRKQRTIASPCHYEGIGIHTGEKVKIRFLPAKEGAGIVFVRTDLSTRPEIPATIEYVCQTERCTTLGLNDVRIHTVEHILSAIKAFSIDNMIIEINAIEPPVADGSASAFVQMIEEVKVVEQEGTLPVLSLEEPIFFSEGSVHCVALPSDRYQISYTLNYPDSKVLKSQFHSLVVNAKNFKREIAPCRTFSQYQEISYLIDQGLIKGGSLDNAVVIKEDAVISKNGLFFPDEMVRHKILDLIGDLALIGLDFNAHIISIRSGHKANVSFAKKIYESLSKECCV